MMMLRMLLPAALLAAVPAAAAPDDVCLAAAERMMEFMVEEVERRDDAFGEEFRSEDGRDRIVLRTAEEMSKDNPAYCGLLLAMPDSSLRAMTRSSIRD